MYRFQKLAWGPYCSQCWSIQTNVGNEIHVEINSLGKLKHADQPKQCNPSLGSCPGVKSCGISQLYLLQLISLSVISSVPVIWGYSWKLGVQRQLVTDLMSLKIREQSWEAKIC